MAKSGRAVEWRPHPYQQEALTWLLSHPRAALFLDPGMGKTAITLHAMKRMHDRHIFDKALLIAPLRVCYEVWPKEIAKWGLDIPHVILHGKDKVGALREGRVQYGPWLHIINFEGLSWLLSQVPNVHELYGYLVIDELSKFKAHNSQRFKMFKKNRIPIRHGLTGSPAANGLMGLFGQAFILDEGRRLGNYFTAFRARYFLPQDPNGYVWRPAPGSPEAIYDKLKDLAFRVGLERAPEVVMPEKHVVLRSCKLPEGAFEKYKELEKEMLTELSAGTLVAPTAAAVSTKCRQIANGAVYFEGDKFEEVHNAKLDLLDELLDELQGSPLLVAYSFRHDAVRIKARHPEAAVIDATLPPQELQRVLSMWDDGALPLLLGHPASMGHGLNLQKSCRHVAWFGPTWDYELYDQFNRRVYRQGNSAAQVFIYHLVAEKTKDLNVLKVLDGKARTQEDLFNALRQDIEPEDIDTEVL